MRSLISISIVVLVACGGASKKKTSPTPTEPSPDVSGKAPPDQDGAPKPPPPPEAVCGGGKELKVKFYDAGQALSALVTLPDGQHILVDAGESPKKRKSGTSA